MKARFGIVAALAVAAVSTAANAAIIATVTPVAGQLTNSFGESVTGYSAFILTLSSDNGHLITAINAGGTGTTGITGPLLQEWDYFGTKSVTYVPSPDKPAGTGLNGQDYGIDSHFLVDPASLVGTLLAPTEDNPAKKGVGPFASGSPGDDTGAVWGTGSSLTMNSGLGVTSQSTTVQLAYVILPTGSVANYNIAVGSRDASNVFDPTSTLTGTIGVASPEPASLGVLAVGALGLLARRKKA